MLRGLLWGGIFLISASLGVALADELQPPLSPSQDIAPSPTKGAGCSLAELGPVVGARLVVRNSLSDVGPYQVTLPGFATDLTDTGGDSYRPFLIRAKPGDTLRIDLLNQLDEADADNIINLHTHGLIVAPRPYFPCNSVGDYIFDSLGPNYPNYKQGGEKRALQYRIDIPETIRGPEGVQRENGEPPLFPSGLYWFHSHVHGSAKNHAFAGQTGVLAIDPKESDLTSAFRAASDERFLVLRDIQLSVPQGMTPDQLAPDAKQVQPTSWLSGDAYDTQACRQASNPWMKVNFGLGYCAHPEVYTGTPGGPYDPNHDFVWLFTINGQLGPTIPVEPGHKQIWRIANTTATVTYLLDLVDGGGTEQTLNLLTLDGVVSGTPDPAKPGEEHPTVALKRLLLMPASRAEVVVNNLNTGAADATYTLRTLGFETGGINQPTVGDPNDPVAQHANYTGDPWPAIDLAKVVFKASPKAASMDELLAQTFTRSSEVQLTAEALAATLAEPAGCVTLPQLDTRRRITLDQDSSTFWIGSEVVDSDGKSVDPDVKDDESSAHKIRPVPFEHATPPFLMRHVCAKLGSDEVWEIDNRTNELHNFHIHQTKFRLARYPDKGLPSGFKPGDAIVDPAGVVSSQVPNFGVDGPVKDVDVWHDTIPVPPATFKFNEKTNENEVDQVGKTFVMIPFEDPVQVGLFVFHCHILEHEDKGMMATVEVYDPKDPGSSRQGVDAGPFMPRLMKGAQRSQGDFCGNPPKDYSPVLLENRSWLSDLLLRFTKVKADSNL
jgi:FtsP/CotA-like multicopper oxidase with cupredoxin domain